MKSKRGISLIVLIITIIIMIILASSIILTLSNSGIINRANEAVEKTDLAQVKNLAALKWAEAYLDENITEKEDYKNYIEQGLRESRINPDDYRIIITENGVEVREKFPLEWKQNVTEIVDTVPIPKGFVASQATGENTKAGGLVIYEGKEAVTDVNVEEARRTRNQYVWVPVASEDFKTKFVRQNFGYMYTETSNILGDNHDDNVFVTWETVIDLATNMPLVRQDLTYVTTTTLDEVQAMYASVKEYEGFYIARYESGIDKQRMSNNDILETNVYSMMGKIPYTYIPWTKNNAMNEDTNGAVQVARSMYPATNTEYGVVSTLTYGVQWDTTLQWWLDTNAVTSLLDSTGYGNYLDHVINSADDLNDGALVGLGEQKWNEELLQDELILRSYVKKDEIDSYPKDTTEVWALSTGALKAANVNNIYDIAGNMDEWTMEGSFTDCRAASGGWMELSR